MYASKFTKVKKDVTYEIGHSVRKGKNAKHE